MADPASLGYTGNYLDSITGGYPLGDGYRWYIPGLMRFNAPDSASPFGIGGTNPYAYCEADPINRSDPSGHSPSSEESEVIDWIVDVVGDAEPIPVREAAPAAPGTSQGTAAADAAPRAGQRRPLETDAAHHGGGEPRAKVARQDLAIFPDRAALDAMQRADARPPGIRFNGRLGQIVDQSENDFNRYRNSLEQEYLARMPGAPTTATDSELREFSFFQHLESRSIGSSIGRKYRASELTGFTTEEDLAEFFGFPRNRYAAKRLQRERRLRMQRVLGGSADQRPMFATRGSDWYLSGVESLIFDYL